MADDARCSSHYGNPVRKLGDAENPAYFARIMYTSGS
jgi:hypothetical protein